MEVGMETKQCNKCKKIKSIDAFYKRKGRPCGVQSNCKVCQGKQRVSYWKPHEVMRRKFNISDDMYEQLMLNDNCQICGCTMTKKCIDHDHKTKKIRGVLCNNCNTALGLFKDNIKVMRKAINYLES